MLGHEISLHVFIIIFCILCDLVIIIGVYSNTRFSTNINLAFANSKVVILFIRAALLVLHLIIKVGYSLSYIV